MDNIINSVVQLSSQTIQVAPSFTNSVVISTQGIQGIQGIQGYKGESYSGTGQTILRFHIELTSGVEAQYVSFPNVLANFPDAISCDIQNDFDAFIYSYAITSVTKDGFTINFSDVLSNSGYILHVIAGV